MTFRPWLYCSDMKTRHCFIEAAYWFVAGLQWQVDRWSCDFWIVPVLERVLVFCGRHLDALRMFIAGYSYVALDKKGSDHAP